jgi:hypothetical protein
VAEMAKAEAANRALASVSLDVIKNGHWGYCYIDLDSVTIQYVSQESLQTECSAIGYLMNGCHKWLDRKILILKTLTEVQRGTVLAHEYLHHMMWCLHGDGDGKHTGHWWDGLGS